MIPIPAEIKERADDYVGYKTKVLGVEQTYIRAACYASHMTSLSKTEFYCMPLGEASILPYDIFVRWIELCKANYLMINNAKPIQDGKKNCLTIDGRDQGRHAVYASLCCYRWSENQAPLAYLVAKGVEECPNLDFFQLFHYACNLWAFHSGHSFHMIIKYNLSNSVYTPATYGFKNNDLLYSLAVSSFFRNKKTKSYNENDYTTNVIGQYQKDFYKGTDVQSFLLDKAEDILWPEWACLYKNEKEISGNYVLKIKSEKKANPA